MIESMDKANYLAKQGEVAHLVNGLLVIIPPCRCCGGTLGIMDGIGTAVAEGVGIHTRCIPKHWTNHAHRKNASRCHEFKR